MGAPGFMVMGLLCWGTVMPTCDWACEEEKSLGFIRILAANTVQFNSLPIIETQLNICAPLSFGFWISHFFILYGAYGHFDFASSPSKEDEEYLFTCIYDYSLFVGTCQCLLLGICGTAMVVHGNFLVPSISTQSPFQMQSPSKNWKFMWLLLKKHCPKPCPALPRQKGEMHVVSWILEL